MIHHIAIATEDPVLLKNFYERLPNLRFEKDHFYPDGKLRSSWFLAGHTRLMIERENRKLGPHALVFSAETPEIRKRVESLLESKIEDRTEFTVYFRDPDGNRLGYSSYPNSWKEEEYSKNV
ncbi:glyoxalase [Leptospira fluminis]|uniref:Glyoxalase n=1 Tax=Leptospira fluminis TaxID=2484979 RepID=A0A4R9GN31_9LEPT|nr:glyoxalase [Leptospira fluminis]TGK15622.1 glyoxalase [Leptospira fluminis]